MAVDPEVARHLEVIKGNVDALNILLRNVYAQILKSELAGIPDEEETESAIARYVEGANEEGTTPARVGAMERSLRDILSDVRSFAERLEESGSDST